MSANLNIVWVEQLAYQVVTALGMRKAIGTAAALGIPISLVASVIYISTGLLSSKTLPEFSFGYVYLPAFAGFAIGGLFTASHGANLAKKINLRWLKFTFAIILLIAGSKMLFL